MRIFFLLLVIVFSSNASFTQTCEINSSDINTTVIVISNCTHYTTSKLNGANGTIIFQVRPATGIDVYFNGLELEQFDRVIFKVERAAKIHVKNSVFTQINKIEFLYNRGIDLYNSYTTEYFISDNLFDNRNNFTSIDTTVLSFRAAEGESVEHFLDNVTIANNKFYIGNNPSQCPSSTSCAPVVAAIGMNRRTSNQHIRNIKIIDNHIVMEGRRVLAVDFTHDFKKNIPNYPNYNMGVGNPSNSFEPYSNFDLTGQSFYDTNKNIVIANNKIEAISTSPHSAIYIQGPYTNVSIKHNIIIGFGLVYENNGRYSAEGAIELYGSRNNSIARDLGISGKNYYYSNNIKDINVSFNYLEAPANGIRISGGNDITIHKNSFNIKDWPSGLSNNLLDERVGGVLVQGGNTWGPPENATENISITYNSIKLNNLVSKIGIGVQHAKDFHIQHNEIDQLKSVGIYYYSDSGYNEDASGISYGIGSSTIISNTLDYEDNPSSQNELNSSAGGINGLDNRGIALFRHDLNYPSNESLDLSGNVIQTTNVTSYVASDYDKVKDTDTSPWDQVVFPSGNSVSVNTKSESSAGIRHITSGDFDGDGEDEYVIRNNDNEYFVAFRDTVYGKHGEILSIGFDVQHWSPVSLFWGDANFESKLKSGDINGDGKDDLIFLNKGNSGDFKIRVALSTGGSFQQFTGHDFSTLDFNSFSYLSMAVGNFDDDESEEIAIRTRSNDFYVMNLVGSTLTRDLVWSDPNLSHDSMYEPTMHSGDFNGDGYDDLFFLRRGNDGKWMLRVMTYDLGNNGFDGKTGYNQSDMDVTFGTTYSKLASCAGDFDGDGDADMMIRRPDDTYFVLRSNGSASFSAKELWKQGYMMWGDSQYPVQTLSGNINGDSRTDLFMWSQSNDNNSNAPGYYILRAAQSKNNDTFHRFNSWELRFDSDGGDVDGIELTPSKRNLIDTEDLEGDKENEFGLDQNYPNPFNPSTQINYTLASKGFVSLSVYDMIGRQVATIVSENQNAGKYTITFDGSNLSSGVYIYRLIVNGNISTGKMTLLK